MISVQVALHSSGQRPLTFDFREDFVANTQDPFRGRTRRDTLNLVRVRTAVHVWRDAGEPEPEFSFAAFDHDLGSSGPTHLLGTRFGNDLAHKSPSYMASGLDPVPTP